MTTASLPSALPVVQAPMAGGPSTVQLTEAVAAAGGYGYLAAGYLTVDALNEAIARTRATTEAPFGVNVFMPSPRPTAADHEAVGRYAATLRSEAARLGTDLGDGRWDDDAYGDKIELLCTPGVAVHGVSFTFGCPDTEVVTRLHDVGSQVHVTVTSVAEARRAETVGADMLVVQGSQAGGHQGRFLGDEPNATSLLDALRHIAPVGLPMIAAGGVMSSGDARAALDAGAVAVALGTALLCAAESGTSSVHRAALLGRRYEDTVVTRAFSGRYARGLANRFAREHTDAPAAYPQINRLTKPLRAAATAAGDPDVPNLWAGTGWRSVSARPAGDIVRDIAAGLTG